MHESDESSSIDNGSDSTSISSEEHEIDDTCNSDESGATTNIQVINMTEKNLLGTNIYGKDGTTKSVLFILIINDQTAVQMNKNYKVIFKYCHIGH